MGETDPTPVPITKPNWQALEEEANTFADHLTDVGMHAQAYLVRDIRDQIARERDRWRGFGPWKSSS